MTLYAGAFKMIDKRKDLLYDSAPSFAAELPPQTPTINTNTHPYVHPYHHTCSGTH